MKQKCLHDIILFSFAVLLTVISSASHANPAGGVVNAGTASISTPAANTVQINQSSSKAIIDWQTFNIGKNEVTHFQQPVGGVTLNRVNSLNGASAIYGSLTATGTIILINAAGIYFGPGAQVSVGSLIASSSDMRNEDFMNGKYIFSLPSSLAGSVINQGTIIAAQHGLIALVGTSVQNDGYIRVNLGNVILASSNKFTVDFSGDQLINFTINEGAGQAGVDANNRTLKNHVSNSGSVIANGGMVLISAQSASEVLDHSINMSGIVEANTVANNKGTIILSANGGIDIAGKINATGKENKQSGGTIKILGNTINIDAATELNVSGDAGGGVIMVGGNVQGSGSEPHALATQIAAGAVLNASAIHSGDGGVISVWSDANTEAHGNFYAQGGSTGGHGGLIETSSHAYLDVNNSHVDTSAAKGQSGIWLLDPADLTISSASDANVTATSPFQPATQLSNSILNVTTLLNALNNGNVVVQTSIGSGSGNGDILVNTAINWNNANSLTLSAYRNITATASISNTGGANVVLRADNTGTGIGTVSFTGGTNVSLSGGSGKVKVYYNPASFGTPQVIYSGGTTPVAYMLVNNAANLQNINNYLTGNFALAKNITLSGNFTPIGSTATPFTGNFDGQNYTINNLTITNTTSSINLGLFGVISSSLINNINLNNVTISQTADNNNNSTYIGSLVGLNNNGSIDNAYVYNPVITLNGTNDGKNGARGYYDVGGLVGASFGGLIQNSASIGGSISNHVNINASGFIAFNEMGGLLGGEHSSAVVQNVYSSTNIISDGNVSVTAGGTGEILAGGLIGRLDLLSVLYDSYSSGTVNVTSTLAVPSGAGYVLIGGLIGATSIANSPSPNPPPSLNNNYSTGDVTLHATLTNTAPGSATILAGGLLGQSNAVLTNAYSTGHVTLSLASDLSAAGQSIAVGGLVGDSFTSIADSYSTSPVIVNGDNHGNQVTIGDLVGSNVTLYDKEITNSYSSGLMNVAMNNYDGGQLFIGGFAGLNIYYGNPPPDRLPFANNYSTSIQNVSGVNDGSTTVVGTFVGANGIDGSNPGGDIINSYSSGFINNNISTINGGLTLAAGFLGQTYTSSDPLSPPIVLANNFYDTGTTGFNQNQGVGNQPGPVSGVTPGCFGGGACPNGGSADLSSQATFASAGWDFSTVWGIINNASYPYLVNSNPSPPQVISGTAAVSAGNIVHLVVNGTVIDSTLTGPNGFYYFFEPNGTIATNNLGLVYLTGSVKSNAVFTPAADGSGSGVNLYANTIQVGSDSALTIANNQLLNVISGLVDSNILYAGSGSTVLLGTNAIPDIEFMTTANTNYQLNGNLNNITGGNSNITFNGPVILTGDSAISSQHVNFQNTLSGNAYQLTMTNTGVTNFANTVNIGNLLVTASAIHINTGSVTTVQDQTYYSPVNLGVDSLLTGRNISFLDGISGNKNLSLQGQSGNNTVIMQGDLVLNNIAVSGSGNGTNTLVLKTNAPEIWNITATNAGNVINLPLVSGVFNFNNFANLTGGDFGNTFNFAEGTHITGGLDGSNVAQLNTINFGNYLSTLAVQLDNTIYYGWVNDNAGNSVAEFYNINYVIGNDISPLILANKSNALTFTAYNAGYVNDPVNFYRFVNFISQSGNDSIHFIAPAIYDLNNYNLTIEQRPVELVNFNYDLFSGNITFIPENDPVVPSDPPSVNISAGVSTVIQAGTQASQNNILDFMPTTQQSSDDLGQMTMEISNCDEKQGGSLYIDGHDIPLNASLCHIK